MPAGIKIDDTQLRTGIKVSNAVMLAKARKGVLKAALFVQREAQRRTPVLTGNLKASAETVLHFNKPEAVVGFSASYAVFVHERTALKHRPPGTSKFLYKAITENKKRILGIIQDAMKV